MKRLKLRFFLLILMLTGFIAKESYSQENIRLSQYFQNAQFYNPAFSGIESFLDIKLGHKQNLGAYEYAPKTSFISLSAPFNASTRRATELYSLRISTPSLYSKLTQGVIEPYRHGLGVVLLNENQEAFTQQTAMLSYAFHVSINKKVNLSIGVSPYYYRNQVDVTKIRFKDDGTNGTTRDQVIDKYAASGILYSTVGVNTGILLYAENIYIGYSIHGAYRKNMSLAEDLSEDESLSDNQMTHTIMGGYKVDFTENLQFCPGFYFNIRPERPTLYTINGKLKYENRYWGGLAYSTSGNFSLIAGMKVNETINLSYSYDYTVAGISNYLSGSHELILGFNLVRNGSKRNYMW
jgi:type IX secretion system PorP/SprF family membrane protein